MMPEGRRESKSGRLKRLLDEVYKEFNDIYPEKLPGGCGDALLMEGDGPEEIKEGRSTQDRNDFQSSFMHFVASHLEKRGVKAEVKIVDQGTVDEGTELNIHWD